MPVGIGMGMGWVWRESPEKGDSGLGFRGVCKRIDCWGGCIRMSDMVDGLSLASGQMGRRSVEDLVILERVRSVSVFECIIIRY